MRASMVPRDLVGTHDQRAGAVERAADDLVARLLRRRHGLPGYHGLVDGARAVQHRTVDRHAIARPDAEPIAELDLGQGNLLIVAVVAQAPRRLRREVQQRADGTRPSARAPATPAPVPAIRGP